MQEHAAPIGRRGLGRQDNGSHRTEGEKPQRPSGPPSRPEAPRCRRPTPPGLSRRKTPLTTSATGTKAAASTAFVPGTRQTDLSGDRTEHCPSNGTYTPAVRQLFMMCRFSARSTATAWAFMLTSSTPWSAMIAKKIRCEPDANQQDRQRGREPPHGCLAAESGGEAAGRLHGRHCGQAENGRNYPNRCGTEIKVLLERRGTCRQADSEQSIGREHRRHRPPRPLKPEVVRIASMSRISLVQALVRRRFSTATNGRAHFDGRVTPSGCELRRAAWSGRRVRRDCRSWPGPLRTPSPPPPTGLVGAESRRGPR